MGAREFGRESHGVTFTLLIGVVRKVSSYVIPAFGTAPHALLQTRINWQLW